MRSFSESSALLGPSANWQIMPKPQRCAEVNICAPKPIYLFAISPADLGKKCIHSHIHTHIYIFHTNKIRSTFAERRHTHTQSPNATGMFHPLWQPYIYCRLLRENGIGSRILHVSHSRPIIHSHRTRNRRRAVCNMRHTIHGACVVGLFNVHPRRSLYCAIHARVVPYSTAYVLTRNVRL